METNRQISISGMECASCERLIEKAVASAGGAVRSIDASRGSAVLDYPEGKFDDVKRAIASAGYSVVGEPAIAEAIAKVESAHHLDNDACSAKPLSFENEMALFVRKLFGGKKELWAERKILKMSLLSLLLLAFAGFFLYLFIWHGKAGVAPKIPFMFYSALSAVSIIAAAAHYRSHKAEFTCMEGMMIGMTIGMIAGFLFGAVVGATNGMFVGSVFGVAVGMVAGAYTGKCCGIMGVMEGMMAGLMGGTMGAMLTVMMLADNLLLFMPLFVGSCIAILAGLTYMMYNSAGKRAEKVLMPFPQFFSLVIILFMVSVAIMVFGPRGPVTV